RGRALGVVPVDPAAAAPATGVALVLPPRCTFGRRLLRGGGERMDHDRGGPPALDSQRRLTRLGCGDRRSGELRLDFADRPGRDLRTDRVLLRDAAHQARGALEARGLGCGCSPRDGRPVWAAIGAPGMSDPLANASAFLLLLVIT